MGRCSNDDIFNKVGRKPYGKETEITFNVLQDLDRCVRVNANSAYQIDATNSQYFQYRIPEDRFNCDPKGCRNTGMLDLAGTADSTVGARWTIPYDATEFYQGLATYYVYFNEVGEYVITTSMSSIRDVSMTNKDTYQQNINVTEIGWRPIIIDFEQTPTETTGSGWQSDEAGAIIEVTVSSTDEEIITHVGISSFYFYDSKEDFQINDVIKLSCLTDISSDLTLDPSDATCFGAQYDANSTAIEYTITARKVTPNFAKLNPLYKKSQQTTGFLIQTDKRTIERTVINGTTYGYIQVPDIDPDECGYIGVQLANLCNVFDSQFEKVNSPIPLSLNERQYIVLDGTITDKNDLGMILFNEDLIGQEVIVSYPKKEDVVVSEYSEKNINNTRVRLYIPMTYTDCTTGAYVFDNVLITSFPMGFSSESDGEFEFSFTISVQRDANGLFFKEVRKKYNY